MIPHAESAQRRHRDGDPEERGFLLVGVAMFVLALTILGVSLFSLSGFEAQFLGQSMRRSQAFYDALGGIDRSLRVLSETNDMNAVASNLPPGIIYARAWQGDDSTTVNWQDTTAIRVRVVAERGVAPDIERRMLEGIYRHSSGGASHMYEDLIATTGRIWLQQYPQNHNSGAPTQPGEYDNVYAYGRIRQNSPNVSGWITDLMPQPATFSGGGVAIPLVDEFIAYWWPQSVELPPSQYELPGFDDDDDDGWGEVDEHRYELNGFSGQVGVFRGPSFSLGDDRKSGFGLSDGCDRDIRFEMGAGRPVIWLLPTGAHFEQFIRVRDYREGDALIIVAGTSTDTTFKSRTGANLGLWFRGGIDCPIPLYLISSGTVSLDRDNDWNDSEQCEHLSIFAAGVHLRGPRRPFNTNPYYIQQEDLQHNLVDDTMCPMLRSRNYLPNTLPGSGGNVQFTLVSGTFQDPPTP